MAPPLKTYDMDYLISKVVKQPSGCWEFQGALDADGYGQVNSHRGLKAHRLAFVLFKGPITSELIRHTCHNRKCCNPEHLIEGTVKQNYDDAVAIGTIKPRELSALGNSVLATPPDVVEALWQHYQENGWTYQATAAEFGVSRQTVANIIKRKIDSVALRDPPKTKPATVALRKV